MDHICIRFAGRCIVLFEANVGVSIAHDEMQYRL